MTAKLQRLSDLKARVNSIVLSAPDRFPMIGPFGPDQKKNLLIVFDELHENLPLVEKKIKDPAVMEQLRQLLQAALAAYQQGDRKKGAHLLQDFQDIVFPNRFREYEMRKGDDAL
jgi:hypothetical protein